MTVKVVSDGPTITKKVTCPRCSYELEFTGADVTYHCDSDGFTSSTIVCPRVECQRSQSYPCTINVKWP